MRRSAWLTSVAATFFVASAAAAQTRPDFTGEWTSELESAAPQRGERSGAGQAAAGGRAGAGRAGEDRAGGGRAAGGRAGGGRGGPAADMGSGWGSTLSITQDARRLTIEYVFFSRGDLQPPLKFVYALDGSATTNAVMMGRGIQEQTSRAAWDGDRLVITTTYPFTDPETGGSRTAEVVRTLSLEGDGSMVVESTIAGVLGGPPTTTRTVYRRP